MNGRTITGPAPLNLYRIHYLQKKCRWCNTQLTGPVKCWGPHSGGYEIEGYKEKQWVYTECPKCEYQWAMHKLGIGQIYLLEVNEKEQARTSSNSK